MSRGLFSSVIPYGTEGAGSGFESGQIYTLGAEAVYFTLGFLQSSTGRTEVTDYFLVFYLENKCVTV